MSAELADFDGDDVKAPILAQPVNVGMGQHSAVSLAGFQDFCLKPELANAIRDNGFEHPSEVQQSAIPKAMLGSDILAQAKSGMGKTAVFVFALLEQIEAVPAGKKPYCQAIVFAHVRELAHQIQQEFKRFNKYLPHCTTHVFTGGEPEEENVKFLKKEVPAIVVGTPGRMKALVVTRKALDVSHVKWFVVDEFDSCLQDESMRRNVQDVFVRTPKEKQVMMFSATITETTGKVAKKFMKDPTEIYVDHLSKLTLHGLSQYYMKLTEGEKLRKLCDILDAVNFNQAIIFTADVARCEALTKTLQDLKFPAEAAHGRMKLPDRLRVFERCRKTLTRIIVSTELFARGVDIDGINLVVGFDMANSADTYLHEVGRAGRFGTKGVTIAFLTEEEKTVRERKYTDLAVMQEVQSRFEMKVRELTDVKTELKEEQYMSTDKS